VYYIKCFPDTYLVKKNPTPIFFGGKHALARFNFRISVYNEVKKAFILMIWGVKMCMLHAAIIIFHIQILSSHSFT